MSGPSCSTATRAPGRRRPTAIAKSGLRKALASGAELYWKDRQVAISAGPSSPGWTTEIRTGTPTRGSAQDSAPRPKS